MLDLEKCTVLMPGGGGAAAIGTIKALRLARFPGRIVSTDADPLSAGLYLADAHYVLRPIADPSFFLKALSVIEREQVNLIFPTSGFDILVYSERKKELEERGVTAAMSDYPVVLNCVDKWRFYQLTCRDFPLPYTSLDMPLPLTHVDSAVEAMLLAGEGRGRSGEAYNVVDHPVTQRQLLRWQRNKDPGFPSVVYVPFSWAYGTATMLDLLSRGRWRSVRYRLQRVGYNPVYDTTKAEQSLGWRPALSLPAKDVDRGPDLPVEPVRERRGVGPQV